MNTASLPTFRDDHTFDAMASPWTEASPCNVNVRETSDSRYAPCGASYAAHTLRPPLPAKVLEGKSGSIDEYGFMTSHKFGCASVVETDRGPCSCGMISWNVGALVYLATHGLSGLGALAVQPSGVMSSSDFRLAYASLEEPTTVTVNGRSIGIWTPTSAKIGD